MLKSTFSKIQMTISIYLFLTSNSEKEKVKSQIWSICKTEETEKKNNTQTDLWQGL